MLDTTKVVKRIPFNVNDFSHRKAVSNFNRNGKWSIYFEVPQGCKNLPYTLSNQVLDYYVGWDESSRTSQREVSG